MRHFLAQSACENSWSSAAILTRISSLSSAGMNPLLLPVRLSRLWYQSHTWKLQITTQVLDLGIEALDESPIAAL